MQLNAIDTFQNLIGLPRFTVALRFIGAVTNTGRTALHLASVNGHRKCLNVLLGALVSPI